LRGDHLEFKGSGPQRVPVSGLKAQIPKELQIILGDANVANANLPVAGLTYGLSFNPAFENGLETFEADEKRHHQDDHDDNDHLLPAAEESECHVCSSKGVRSAE